MIRLVSLLFAILLAGCATSPGDRSWITYRIDVRQGNLITQEMAAQLKMGQTKDQVRFILGTPLIADMFHADRWDYVYSFQPGRIGSNPEKRHLVVLFERGKLVGVGGDVIAFGEKVDTPPKPATQVIDIAPSGDSK